MKRFVSLIFTILLITTVIIPVNATATDQLEAAESLYALGLFQGTGTDEKGNPIFDLDKIPTRAQATIMLVRLLGKEDEAKSSAWTIPFIDVNDSLKPYVGCVYKAKLSNGKTNTIYGSSDTITAAQYITFVLRALGYDSSSDFTVGTACSFAKAIGLTNGEYTNDTINFNRGDVAKISYNALSVRVNNTEEVLSKHYGISLDTSYNRWSEEEKTKYHDFESLWDIEKRQSDSSYSKICPTYVLTHNGVLKKTQLITELKKYTHQEIKAYLMHLAINLNSNYHSMNVIVNAPNKKDENASLIEFTCQLEYSNEPWIRFYY